MEGSKKRVVYTLVATMIIVFSTTFALLMTLERIDYRNYLQSQYSKNLYNMVGSVENIRTNLGKVAIVGSREQSISVFNEIFKHASMANENLHSLPISQATLGNTSKFLTQVGDFCYVLGNSASKDVKLTNKEFEQINDLEMQAYSLETELNSVINDINKGKVSWGEIRKKTSTVFAKEEDNLANKFTSIQKQIIQYPVLIYDGPFSDNSLNIKPKVIGEKEVTIDKCKESIQDLYGKQNISKIENIQPPKDKKAKGGIPSYRFNVDLKNKKEGESIVAEVSKNGGHIVYLLYNKAKGAPKLKPEEAEKIGMSTLQKMGYKGMMPTFKLKYEDYLVVNYVYKEGDVTIYPDQIKVKISLIDGSIIGIESDKYLISHVKDRKIPNPKITPEKGKERVGKNLDISKISLAIIPTETNTEVLCYEYLGTYRDKKYIVYINAQTGYEERIVEIINTPNGELTI
ncbi:germination protein YpeB [Hathewaya histolytica]|uniref:Membrane-associated protein n=1 Tax=Hathewaya histolytica TaxID=1498 RepID=A0A4U9RRK4_HATHI|nr:germination protein YpeB [Hathewaya histolytica]VTQ94226.1 membrane-associated protein [Hathewaya histolytica]